MTPTSASPSAPEACERCRQSFGDENPLFCKNCGRQWHAACFTGAKLCPKCSTPVVTKAAHQDAKANLEVSAQKLTNRTSTFLLLANVLTICTWAISQTFANMGNAGRVAGLPGANATEIALLSASAGCALSLRKFSHAKIAMLGAGLAAVAFFNTSIGLGLDPYQMGRLVALLKLAFYFSPVACIITALYALNDRRQVVSSLLKKRA